MRLALRVAGALGALAVVALLLALGFLFLARPKVAPPWPGTVERTPERLARGRYLVDHVLDCQGCHAERDFARFGGPVKPGTEGAGGVTWDETIGFPGHLVAGNVTPDRETGLGAWSDGEILRAMREGVDREGHGLFPVMPYASYRALSDDDARAVVASLRALPAVRRARPPRTLRFPLPLVARLAPEPVRGAVAAPDPRDRAATGKYLVTVAACRECHTPHDAKGRPLEGKDFQGGWEMRFAGGRVVTANITPNPRVFTGQATREQFVGRFQAFAAMAADGSAPPVPKGKATLMPWLAYAGMTAEDLGAIYDYLKTLPPGGGWVETFPDAPEPPPPPGGAVLPGR